MGRRLLLASLLAAALVADASGGHSLAFWALVAAVPAAATCALASFATFLDAEGDAVASLQALLWAPVLLLVLASAAVRGPVAAAGESPRIAETALVACLAVLGLKALLHAGALAYRRYAGAIAIPAPTRF